ncbi:spore germination protein [Ammoniphilus sp. 3BR4]|uniref:spore germination protein n=1 Tax=Ammoniphilus sp. 3BR4 TaxID=3158265 RepID=UPI0034675018
MNDLKETLRNLMKKIFSKEPVSEVENHSPILIHGTLQKNIQHLKDTFGKSEDLILRKIKIGKQKNIEVVIIYIDGLAKTESISNFIMESIMLDFTALELENEASSTNDLLNFIKESILTASEVKDITDFATIGSSILSGDTVILIDGYNRGFSISTAGWQERGVEEPTSQTVVRGPKEGFTENFRTNTTLVRRKIKSSNLWIETKQVGKVTQTNVGIMYINGIANEKVVDEVRSRIDRIQIDAILESGYIEELIQDKTFTPFPTVYNSERPDVIAAGLLEGRVAIVVDGTPFVLLVPGLFTQYFQSAEDYYHRSDFGLIRFLRYIALFLALLGPSFYIAITTFHQEMLPTQLLMSIAAQREGVPFPAFVEAVMMEIAFEILREAGVRMPRAVGQAVSIVGALVIGQAAVEAGIVSAAMVIVVSITAIANFSFPAFNMAISIRILRFAFMFLAASFGLFGITVGLLIILLQLCNLKSFGIPYLTPMAPFFLKDQKDTIIRFPHWSLFSRPRLVSQKNMTREQTPPPTKSAPRRRK